MSWEDNNFPDADDSNDVGWMVISWKTVPCRVGCKGNYALHSRQFDHLGIVATKKEADTLFKKYVDMHITNGKNANRKNFTLFLTKVVDHVNISNNKGDMI
jgi:hypothetical protein